MQFVPFADVCFCPLNSEFCCQSGPLMKASYSSFANKQFSMLQMTISGAGVSFDKDASLFLDEREPNQKHLWSQECLKCLKPFWSALIVDGERHHCSVNTHKII